jgi:hypothetical protein
MGLRPAQGDDERSVWQPLSVERLPSPLSSRPWKWLSWAFGPSKVMENASVQQPLSMERLPSPLSSRAKPRDLQFRGPFVEMFFDRASWLPAVSANNTQNEAACERSERLDRQVQ